MKHLTIIMCLFFFGLILVLLGQIILTTVYWFLEVVVLVALTVVTGYAAHLTARACAQFTGCGRCIVTL